MIITLGDALKELMKNLEKQRKEKKNDGCKTISKKILG